MKPLVLLVGNGPSATSKPMGRDIDDFPGVVVRFNTFRTAGFEEFVGTRTDVWSTCLPFSEQAAGTYDETLVVSFEDSPRAVPVLTEAGHRVQRIPLSTVDEARTLLGHAAPSSGVILATHYLRRGYEVWLWGFDFMQDGRAHHYGDDGERGPNHDPDSEWLFFQTRIASGAVRVLGHDSAREGIPIIRQPIPCGTDADLSCGRAPCQMGWYEWAGALSKGLTVLDVGAGMGDGLRAMRQAGAARATGWDADPRLAGVDPEMLTGGSLRRFAAGSFDVVTCMDVIEHVVADRVLLADMLRIARRVVYVTTPNWTRSRARNGHHCREYSIAQFCNAFEPEELWVASPNGKHHLHCLLRRVGGAYVEAGTTVRHPVGGVPLDYRFNRTPDGLKWPHLCGVFFR